MFGLHQFNSVSEACKLSAPLPQLSAAETEFVWALVDAGEELDEIATMLETSLGRVTEALSIRKN